MCIRDSLKIDEKVYRTIWPITGADSTKNDVRFSVQIIDQTMLPHRFEVKELAHLDEMIVAIKTMQVRGAPLIGAAAAYGMALAVQENASDIHIEKSAKSLLQSRPTAVNLRWAVKRMQSVLAALPPEARLQGAWHEAALICDEDVQINHAIGQHGLSLIEETSAKNTKKTFNILTHCNAGWLATVDWGTALAPIYKAHDAGMNIHVWVDETRPRNQGASLTAWELGKHGVPHTVISDNAGGHLMQHGQVDMVIVGADRVTSTGDVCNKIGTYLKALAAFDNQVPFYVAVPSPTIDWAIHDGLSDIEIEMRDAKEVSYMSGLAGDGSIQSVRITPEHCHELNPAFDVTPARLVTGIITERGVTTPSKLKQLFE
ncbi:MAG: S-methyl-5-thioribose-1-phosphate isomerase [Methylophilaceae bacterium]|nr:S-methyl-5-thioribose-1-phosphate isomerase [Methylophilaceae bacterium]